MSAAADSKAVWRRDLATHAVHGIPPLGAPYVLGRWHKDRASLSGYAFEAQVWAKSLFVRNAPRRFLMVGRPRSGTSLLRDLLNQVDGLHCDGEVLHHAVLAPHAFLKRLAGIKQARVYGSKLLTYQIFEVQKIADVPGFFERLAADGCTLIHVRRATFGQSLSLTVAQLAGRAYHIRGAASAERQRLTVDPDLFARQIRHNRAALDYEDRLFSELPHHVVQYEHDLSRAERHQSTVDRLCAVLNIASGPVAANLSRVSEYREVTNLDMLRAVAMKEGCFDAPP